MDALEPTLASQGNRPLRYRPIFIIGAPRSGSTLLYQVLVNAWDVAYLSNAHCRHYYAPSLVERFVSPLRDRPDCPYQSQHGATEGPAAPSECGEFWYRFFRRKPQYVPAEAADPAQMRRLRGVMRAFGNACGKHILFKNMPCALRLAPLGRTFPEAVFLVIHRDLLDNAHSILEVRQKIYGNYARWWSMEPPAIEALRQLPPHAQAIEQVRHIEQLMARDRQLAGPARFLDLDYEALCAAPAETVETIRAFLESHEICLRRRAPLPASFPNRRAVRIEPALYDKLVAYAQPEPRHG